MDNPLQSEGLLDALYQIGKDADLSAKAFKVSCFVQGCSVPLVTGASLSIRGKASSKHVAPTYGRIPDSFRQLVQPKESGKLSLKVASLEEALKYAAQGHHLPPQLLAMLQPIRYPGQITKDSHDSKRAKGQASSELSDHLQAMSDAAREGDRAPAQGGAMAVHNGPGRGQRNMRRYDPRH